MEVSEYIILREDIYTPTRYKVDSRITRRPKKIAEITKNKAVIWVDECNKKIGFTSGKYAQIFDKNELKGFQIKNCLLTKVQGWSNFIIHFKDEQDPVEIFMGGCRQFDDYAEKIEQMTGKTINFTMNKNSP